MSKKAFQVLNNLDYDYDDEDPVGVRTVGRPAGFDDEEEEDGVENKVEQLVAKETKLEARRPYFLQNGFFYHRSPRSFYHHPYGHFQRYRSAASYPRAYPYTYSYYLL